MAEIQFDSPLSDLERRRRLYDGAVFVYPATATTREFCEFASSLIQEAFQGLDPETAQNELPVERYVSLLSELKPRFIHHPESKIFLRRILEERGCDPNETYFDVPRMRSSTSDGYLTTGIAYAWHPHRDTWYSAPASQINWWTPIYPITEGNGMYFYMDAFRKTIANTSGDYDYVEWNAKHRYSAANHVAQDTRPLPGPVDPIDQAGAMPVVCGVGDLVVFSAAHLHGSVENLSGRTRFSIDFRTVNLGDCETRTGAPDQDVACTNSSIRDFKRLADGAEFPDGLATAFEDNR